jgi:hypothetical protein
MLLFYLSEREVFYKTREAKHCWLAAADWKFVHVILDI